MVCGYNGGTVRPERLQVLNAAKAVMRDLCSPIDLLKVPALAAPTRCVHPSPTRPTATHGHGVMFACRHPRFGCVWGGVRVPRDGAFSPLTPFLPETRPPCPSPRSNDASFHPLTKYWLAR